MMSAIVPLDVAEFLIL